MCRTKCNKKKKDSQFILDGTNLYSDMCRVWCACTVIILDAILLGKGGICCAFKMHQFDLPKAWWALEFCRYSRDFYIFLIAPGKPLALPCSL
jgi:hypothetical protein